MSGLETLKEFLSIERIHKPCLTKKGGANPQNSKEKPLCGDFEVRHTTDGHVQIVNDDLVHLETIPNASPSTGLVNILTALPNDVLDQIIGYVDQKQAAPLSTSPNNISKFQKNDMEIRLSALALTCKGLYEMFNGTAVTVTTPFFLQTFSEFLLMFMNPFPYPDKTTIQIGHENEEATKTYINIEIYKQSNSTRYENALNTPNNVNSIYSDDEEFQDLHVLVKADIVIGTTSNALEKRFVMPFTEDQDKLLYLCEKVVKYILVRLLDNKPSKFSYILHNETIFTKPFEYIYKLVKIKDANIQKDISTKVAQLKELNYKIRLLCFQKSLCERFNAYRQNVPSDRFMDIPTLNSSKTVKAFNAYFNKMDYLRTKQSYLHFFGHKENTKVAAQIDELYDKFVSLTPNKRFTVKDVPDVTLNMLDETTFLKKILNIPVTEVDTKINWGKTAMDLDYKYRKFEKEETKLSLDITEAFKLIIDTQKNQYGGSRRKTSKRATPRNKDGRVFAKASSKQVKSQRPEKTLKVESKSKPTRQAPREPAKLHVGKTKQGVNGKRYTPKQDKNGVWRWALVKAVKNNNKTTTKK